VGGGLSGLYRYASGQEPCAGRRPRSRDIDRNALAMATAGALGPKAAERPERSSILPGLLTASRIGHRRLWKMRDDHLRGRLAS
jgi:hypothetical protein